MVDVFAVLAVAFYLILLHATALAMVMAAAYFSALVASLGVAAGMPQHAWSAFIVAAMVADFSYTLWDKKRRPFLKLLPLIPRGYVFAMLGGITFAAAKHESFDSIDCWVMATLGAVFCILGFFAVALGWMNKTRLHIRLDFRNPTAQ